MIHNTFAPKPIQLSQCCKQRISGLFMTEWHPITCFRVCTTGGTRRWFNAGLLLVQRRRRWTNNNPTLDQRLFSLCVMHVALHPCQIWRPGYYGCFPGHPAQLPAAACNWRTGIWTPMDIGCVGIGLYISYYHISRSFIQWISILLVMRLNSNS